MNARKRTPELLQSGFVPASLFALSLAGTLLTGTVPSAQADASSKADAFLGQAQIARSASGWACVIVRIDGDLTSEREAQMKTLGADVYRHLPLIHSLAVRVPARNLARLEALPFVRHLSSDASVTKCDEFTVGSSGAAVAWAAPYNLSGQGIAVAVVDSGVTPTSPDLTSSTTGGQTRIVGSVSFISGSGPADQCGHGTHVAGIIAGNGAASTGSPYTQTFYGIAQQANIVNVRVLDQNGQAAVSTVIAGVQWVVANQAQYNIRVMNLSLGHDVGESYTTDPLCQAVEQAWKAGIVVVCAAGNEGRLNSTNTPGLDNEGWGTAYGSIQSPGNDPYVITVGATKSMDGNRVDDRIATYSSRGPSRLDLVLKPDIVAPGNQVISLASPNSYLDHTYGATNDILLSYYRVHGGSTPSHQYFRLSGTSMASPVVAGAAVLLLQANPSLTPNTIKARLMISADKWGFPDGSIDPCTFGAGYLNIPAALNCPVVATQYALSPTLSQDSQGNASINLDGTFWGPAAIWGTGITDLHAIWGKTAIWSANTLSSSHALWGMSVWSDHAIWGKSTAAVDLTCTAINGE